MWHTRSLQDRYDVVIIGGGVHGLATAYYLARDHGVTAWRPLTIWPEITALPTWLCWRRTTWEVVAAAATRPSFAPTIAHP
jgi:hypothetical protein